MFSESEILRLPFILSGLCWITDHSMLNVIREKASEWLEGFMHSFPSEQHASYISRGLCGAAERGQPAWKYELRPPRALWSSVSVHADLICLGPLYKICCQNSPVCFHLVVYGLCPQIAWGTEERAKKNTAFPCAVLNLACKSMEFESQRYWRSAGWGGVGGIFYKHKKTMWSDERCFTFQVSQIGCTAPRNPSLKKMSPCCWSDVWRKFSKISRLISVKHLSSDNSTSPFLPAMI